MTTIISVEQPPQFMAKGAVPGNVAKAQAGVTATMQAVMPVAKATGIEAADMMHHLQQLRTQSYLT